MSELAALIDAHLAADADPDARRRVATVQRIRADSGQLVDPAGAVVLEGLDTAQSDAQGRLRQVTGFFGPLPGLEPA
jgi:hypothetical protein